MNQRTFPEPQAYETGPRPQIPLVDVESHQVRAIGYCAETRTLAVTFKRGPGAIYHYPNVSPELHQQFVNAESIGRFHGEHIRALPFLKYPAEVEA